MGSSGERCSASRPPGGVGSPAGSFGQLLEVGHEAALRPSEASRRGRAVSPARASGADTGADRAYGGCRRRQLRTAVTDACRCRGRCRVRERRRKAAARRAGGGATAELLADDIYGQSTLDWVLPGSGIGACTRTRVLPQSEDEERRAVRPYPPGGRATVRPERVSAGVRRAARVHSHDLDGPLCQPCV